MKYRVKPGCTIAHEDKEYNSGDELELTEKLALFHAANIEVVEEITPIPVSTMNYNFAGHSEISPEEEKDVSGKS